MPLVVALALLLAARPSLADEEAPPAEVAAAQASAPEEEEGMLNRGLAKFNSWIDAALFFSVTGSAFDQPVLDADGKPVLDESGKPQMKAVGMPFIVFVLVAGGIFYTLFYRFIGIRGFTHAIDAVRGKFDRPEDEGDLTHFRALTSALSATVGLGNIAGVAIAIQVGGPGAVLWMMVAAAFGMALKFNSCTLAQMFRQLNPDGSVSGGPMYYLDLGLRQLGGGKGTPLAMLGKTLGVIYAFMVMGGSFGGGNMFQANQSFGAIAASFDVGQGSANVFGIVLAVMVGLVIIGGIQRIGAATSKIVPAMVSIYVLASLFIIVTNIGKLPAALGTIVTMAFTDNAAFGGAVGVLVMGFTRASFSNEAGIGSAAIAHAAAKTDQPVREGLVAMLGPVIDTHIVCLMTASVVVITGTWNDPALASVSGDLKGVQLTAAAFGQEISWFPYVLTVSVLLFAYSTMISWAYYGERGWIYLVDHITEGAGQRTLIVYRLIFVSFVYVGSVTKLGHVLAFSDYMILCMAFPNIVGGLMLAPRVRAALNTYWAKLNAGEFDIQPAAKPSPQQQS